jgi:hypothetical protein
LIAPGRRLVYLKVPDELRPGERRSLPAWRHGERCCGSAIFTLQEQQRGAVQPNNNNNNNSDGDGEGPGQVSFWDKVERRQRLAADEGAELRDLQIELWGWCDERPRDGIRTRHNGWAGNLLRPPPRRNGGNVVGGNLGVGAADDLFLVEMVQADDLPVAEVPMTDPPAAVTPTPGAERYEVQTLAELIEYVSAARDSGGSSYCATKTWFGCGLDDVFQGFASREGLSGAERSALSARMRNAMPLCRNCWCNGRKPVKCVA